MILPRADRGEGYDFSLMLGGPLYQLYRRTHLVGSALDLATRRAIVLSLLAWAPLLALSSVQGNAVGGVHEPFLFDIEVHARLLVALPLLVWAELLVHRRMRTVVFEFERRGIIQPPQLERFDTIVGGAVRLRNSVLAEVLLLVFVYCVGVGIIWRAMVAMDIDTWYRHAGPMATQFSEIGAHFTLAGWWYALISLPLFQLILYRWYFRLAIWIWLLWKVSNLKLHLFATHPDRCGGMGFLEESVYGLAPLLAAHGAIAAGVAGSGIFFDNKTLGYYWPGLLGMLVLVVLIAVGPLLTFVPALIRTRREALLEYGRVGQRYVRDFDQKWVREGEWQQEPLLGTADIQSLSDFSHSFDVIAEMRLIPMSRQLALSLLVIACAPVVPLLFTMVSPKQLGSLLLHGFV